MEIKYKTKMESNKDVLETYEFVFKEMDYEFSSTAFIRALRELGFSESMIQSQKHMNFLKKKCHRLTRNTFAKKNPKVESLDNLFPVQEKREVPVSALNISECIDFLKSNGYKVYKPVTEFIEL